MTQRSNRKWESYELAEQGYEDSIARRYNRDYHEPPLMQWHTAAFVDFVARFFVQGDRVLDLACGPASLWPDFLRTLPNAQLTGVDLSPKMIEESRAAFPSGDFRVGSFFDIPAESGSFDVVIVSSAFHHLPDNSLGDALAEINRVLDEHGVLVGREPVSTGRLFEQGGWVSGALMHFRHLVYRLTHTRELPEPAPTDAHHAYDPEQLLKIVAGALSVTNAEFRHPVSPIVSRVRHPLVVHTAQMLDRVLDHRYGQEVYYAARRNFSTAEDVTRCIRQALIENRVTDLSEFLALLESSAKFLEQKLSVSGTDDWPRSRL